MANERVDWAKAKRTYVTGRMGYRVLAEKLGVNYKVLMIRAGKEHWVQERKDYRARTFDKAIQKISDQQAEKIARIYADQDRVDDLFLKLVERYLSGDLDALIATGANPAREIGEILKAQQARIDIRNHQFGILDPKDAAKHEIEKQKLELEKKKLDAAENATDEIVVRFEGADDIE